jgi:hypothetical protein
METTNEILNKLHDALLEAYKAQLAGFGSPRNKAATKQREALADGFSDGLRTGMRHVCKMLEVEIK